MSSIHKLYWSKTCHSRLTGRIVRVCHTIINLLKFESYEKKVVMKVKVAGFSIEIVSGSKRV